MCLLNNSRVRNDLIKRVDQANTNFKKDKDGPIIANWNQNKSSTTSGNTTVADANTNRSSLSTNDSRRG